MAKIEIKGSPEELERVATFLANNNVKFDISCLPNWQQKLN